MIFCGTTLLSGERKNVPLPVPDAPPLNAICLCGAARGRTLVVTGGVHGCEYVGPQALRRLAGELDPARLSGNVILLPLANPSAFYAGAGVSKFPQSIIVGLCQPKFHCIIPGGFGTFNDGRKASIPSVILAEIHRHSHQ